MDRFDEIYDKQYRGNKSMPVEGNEYIEGQKRILEEKNEFLYKFLSGKKTMIFLIVLVISFGFSAYNNLTAWFDGSQEMTFFSFINDVALLVFAMLLPIAVNKIYNGAKRHFSTDVVLGLNIARTYLLILRVLLIILSVAIGILFLMSLSYMTGWLFLFMLFLVAVAIVGFIMVKLFKEYIEELRGAVQKYNILLPSAKSIIKYMIFMLVVLVVLDISLIIGVEYFVNNLGVILEEIELSTAQIIQLQNELSSLIIYSYISLILGILIQGYILYYFINYNKEVLPYNTILRKQVSELKDIVYEEKINEGNENIKMNWGD